MKTAIIQSFCECQARLGAELDEQKQVLRGWATERRRGTTRRAPAHSIHSSAARFQVAWACPVCTRNVLRSFDSTGLYYAEAEAETAAAS